MLSAQIPWVHVEVKNMKSKSLAAIGNPKFLANQVHKCSVDSGMVCYFSLDLGVETRVRDATTGEPCAVLFDSEVQAADNQTHSVGTWGLLGPLGHSMANDEDPDALHPPRAGSIRIKEKRGPGPERSKRVKNMVFYPNIVHKTKRRLPKHGGKFDKKTTHRAIKLRAKVVSRLGQQLSAADRRLHKASGWRFEVTFASASPLECFKAFNIMVEKKMWDPRVAVPGVDGFAIDVKTVGNIADLTAQAALRAIGLLRESTHVIGSKVHRTANVTLFNSLAVSTDAHQTCSNIPFSSMTYDEEAEETVFAFDMMQRASPKAKKRSRDEMVDEAETCRLGGRLFIGEENAGKLPKTENEAVPVLKELLDEKEVINAKGEKRFYAFYNDTGQQISNQKTRKLLARAVFRKLGAPDCWTKPKFVRLPWASAKAFFESNLFEVPDPDRRLRTNQKNKIK